MTVLPFTRRRGKSDAPQRRKSCPVESAADLFARAVETDDLHPEEGISLYRHVLRVDPHHDLSMSNLGRLYFEQKNYGAAETWWLRALEVNPKQPEANYNLGYLRAMQGAYSGAVDFFYEAISIDDEFAEAHYNLADTLEKLGRSEEARIHWRRYVQIGGPFARQAMAALGMRVVK
jgi:tetratricopeptide (TPR) repeat protein